MVRQIPSPSEDPQNKCVNGDPHGSGRLGVQHSCLAESNRDLLISEAQVGEGVRGLNLKQVTSSCVPPLWGSVFLVKSKAAKQSETLVHSAGMSGLENFLPTIGLSESIH